MAQTFVRRAEVIDRPDQIQFVMQCQRATCQCAASPRQRRQTFSERGVQPLDIGRVDHAVALRAMPEHLDARWRTIHNAAFDVDHTPLRIALDNLSNTDVFPGVQPRASMGVRSKNLNVPFSQHFWPHYHFLPVLHSPLLLPIRFRCRNTW
jgi:hypothetical protein